MKTRFVNLSTLGLVVASLAGCNNVTEHNVSVYTGNTSAAELNSSAVANRFVENYFAVNYSLTVSDLSGSPVYTRSTQTRSINLRSVQLVDDTFYGECGGYLDYQGIYDDFDDYLDVEVSAINFCEYGERFDGEMLIQGYPDALSIDYLNFNYRDDYYGTDYTLYGDVLIEERYPLTKVTTNLIVDDNLLRQSYRLRNWQEIFDESVYPSERSLSGEITDSVFGSVEVVTLQPIITDYYGQPEAGQLLILGYRSSAWVTFYSSGYLVEVDRDDDAFIDDSDLYGYHYY
ncbi:MAG: hypothetical protein U9R28_03945 [Pseudomonadota bacterium]|nr:hypothetical protein [Pseudomonadota bacterium]